MSKEELRQQTSVSVLNALLETTQHSVIDALLLKDIYAKVAVMYADSLIEALEIDKDELKKWALNNKMKGVKTI